LHLLLEDNPHMRGIVFDRPDVVEGAVEETARRGLSNRTEVIGGDFFSSVPSADLYLVKMIMHDWADDNCIAILRNIRAAMNPGEGRARADRRPAVDPPRAPRRPGEIPAHGAAAGP